MNYKQFVNALFTVIALLLGLSILQMALIGYATTEMPYLWELQYVSYFMWIPRLVFGIVVFMLVRQDFRTRISISALSVMAPYYGALFYLLISTIKKKDK